MVRDLASLLAPVSEQSFLDHFLEKKRLHVRSTDPARAVSLFSWATINRLIQTDVLPPGRIRVMRANIDVPAPMFRHKDGVQQLRAGALQALLPQGVSVVINGVSDLVPQIARLSDAIERRLGHRAWVNAYLSFGRGSALKAHWDPHDVLVLQVHGSKRWRSYGTPMPFPVETNGPSGPFGSDVVWESSLEPGDVLYLPRGEVHEAALEGSNSVHLTVGIQVPCGIDFLCWLADKASADVLARADLPRLGGEAALHEHEMRLKERLHALLDATSLAAYLDAGDATRKPRPLLSIGLDERVEAATMVVPALRRRIPLSTSNDDALTVSIGGEPHRLSATARRVLDLLVQRNGLAFSELVAEFGGTIRQEVLGEAVIDLAKRGLAGLGPPERP
jgi:ribosomal protein L16 Arg81 hydroxylase